MTRKEIETLLDETNQHIKMANQQLKNLKSIPSGSLNIKYRGNKAYYYIQESDKNGNWKQRYIPAKEGMLAKKLAQKYYCLKLIDSLKANQILLKEILHNFTFQAASTIYDNLEPGRKALVQPIGLEIREEIKRWREEEYTINDAYPENKRYETQAGDMVRSKSEAIIANMLYAYKDQLEYRYEKPLVIKVANRDYIIHPDFTIINLITGKIFYWEHAGLMSDPQYVDNFIWKHNQYMANDILPGRDLIITYESEKDNLDTRHVKKMIESMLI